MRSYRNILFSTLAFTLALPVPVSAIVVSTGLPSGAVVSYGETVDGLNLSGVVAVSSSIGGCSGTLLAGGNSILTAAHCVTTAYGAPLATNVSVAFLGPSGLVSESVSNVTVDPGYTGNSAMGSDLAVLTLSSPAPSFATGYTLYTNTALPTGPEVVAGYGETGTGLTGGTGGYGTLRAGENEYVANAAAAFNYSSTLLIGEFYESGVMSTNPLGVANPYSASDEVDINFGDSGGPSFYNGQLIGVHDLLICEGNSTACSVPPSVSSSNDSFFGQLYADTSVADNLAFIENASSVPEPGTIALIALGLGLVFLTKRR